MIAGGNHTSSRVPDGPVKMQIKVSPSGMIQIMHYKKPTVKPRSANGLIQGVTVKAGGKQLS